MEIKILGPGCANCYGKLKYSEFSLPSEDKIRNILTEEFSSK